MTFLWACFAAVLIYKPLFANPVARVNGRTIQNAELETYLARNPSVEPASALEQLILFRIAVEAARKQEVDKLPDVRDAFERILYNKYLELELTKSGQKLSIDDDKRAELYRESPLLEIRELQIQKRTGTLAQRKQKQIQKALASKKDFRSLALRYSQADTRRYGGRLDSRGRHNYAPELYSHALRLKNGEVSSPIAYGDDLYWIQRIEEVPFDRAPTPYVQWLKQRHRSELETRFLEQRLKELRDKAVVKIYPTTPKEETP